MFLDRTVDFFRALAKPSDVSDEPVRATTWEALEKAYHHKHIVIGQLKVKTAKGYIVSLGDIDAFMPYYRFDNYNYPNIPLHMRHVDYQFHILDFDRELEQIQVSHLSVVKEEMRAAIRAFERGDVVKAEVTSVSEDYGATVDIDGVTALLPTRHLSWKPVQNPHDIVRVGNLIDVQVMAVKAAKLNLVVGLKQCDKSTWGEFLQEHEVGSRLSVSVVRITDYGYLVATDQGVKGLIHISEVSWSESRPVLGKLHKKGDVLTVRLTEIDHEREQLALSLKQCDKNPWDQLQRRYQVGDIADFTIAKNVGYGLLVHTAFDVFGLVHHSELSWLLSGQANSSNFQAGEQLRLRVVKVDAANRQFHLSFKQLAPNPFAGAVKPLQACSDDSACLPVHADEPVLRIGVTGSQHELPELNKRLRTIQDEYVGKVRFKIEHLVVTDAIAVNDYDCLVVLVDDAYLASDAYPALLRGLAGAGADNKPFILPLIVGAIANWHSYGLSTYACLPVNHKPASQWRSRLLCWVSIERGLHNVIDHLCSESVAVSVTKVLAEEMTEHADAV